MLTYNIADVYAGAAAAAAAAPHVTVWPPLLESRDREMSELVQLRPAGMRILYHKLSDRHAKVRVAGHGGLSHCTHCRLAD